MKKLVTGIIIGSCLTATTATYADTLSQYILTKIDYPIIVSGKQFDYDELPALNYNGNTYLPLKAVGDVLGASVKWNEQMKRVEVDRSQSASITNPEQPEQVKTPDQVKQEFIESEKKKGVTWIDYTDFMSYMSRNHKDSTFTEAYEVGRTGSVKNYLLYRVYGKPDARAYYSDADKKELSTYTFYKVELLKQIIPSEILDGYLNGG